MSADVSTVRELRIVPLSAIQVENVEWLWPPYLPLGKVSLIEGDPESGKTYLALEIAAAITTGRSIPVEIPTEEQDSSTAPGSVLYFTGEDGFGDTIKPRFLNQGGDVDRFFVVEGMIERRNGKEREQGFTLKCVSELEAALRQYNPKAVFIDPISAFLGSDVNMNLANEVRPLMKGLADLAGTYHCSIVGIRHLNKGGSGNAKYRGSGSIDFTAAARSVILTGEYPYDHDQLVMVHLKSSLGPKGPSLIYGIGASGLNWGGPTGITAEEVLQPANAPLRADDPVIAFLRAELADGPKASREIAAAAKLRGIGRTALDRAKKALGVICAPEGVQGQWLCRLPEPAGALPMKD